MSHTAWRDLCKYGKIRRIRQLFSDHIADLVLSERAKHKARQIH